MMLSKMEGITMKRAVLVWAVLMIIALVIAFGYMAIRTEYQKGSAEGVATIQAIKTSVYETMIVQQAQTAQP